jgi:hypothetical protein
MYLGGDDDKVRVMTPTTKAATSVVSQVSSCRHTVMVDLVKEI